MAAMLRLTLDTNCVIHAAQAQAYAPQMAELRALNRDGRVSLWITEAFTVDQERASADKHRLNLAWLSEQPVMERVPGPCRRGYSRRGGPDLRTDAETAAVDAALCELLLPGKATVASRQKITDVQHLTAHLMAGHDAFVTSDRDDMLDKAEAIRRRSGIVIVNPVEAVQMAHGQAA
jgi:hypothetical protein